MHRVPRTLPRTLAGSLGNGWRRRGFQSSHVTFAGGRPKVLVLGGTGFVGQQLCKDFTKLGYDIVSVSRRAPISQSAAVKLISGDLVRSPEIVRDVIATEGPFEAVVHAIGMLLPNDWNALASGSGSKPSPGTTYDQITRRSAITAAEATAELLPGAPFCFVSAAEAGWTTDPPFLPGFLVDYLIAKRAVEARLDEMGRAGQIRPIVLRPSLIWTTSRPAALPAVAAFAVANALGIPGIDRPVMVETLTRAAVYGVTHAEVSGILDYKAMEELAARSP